MPPRKSTKKPNYDPAEVQPLLDRAQAGDIEARNELAKRFEHLTVSLVRVCLSGRPNPFAYSEVRFLKLWASPSTPRHVIGAMLRRELEHYGKDELAQIGRVAILDAIARTNKNLAATITLCFKERIQELVRSAKTTSLDSATLEIPDEGFEDRILLELFLSSLSEEDQDFARSALAGDTPEGEPSEALKSALAQYLGRSQAEILQTL